MPPSKNAFTSGLCILQRIQQNLLHHRLDLPVRACTQIPCNTILVSVSSASARRRPTNLAQHSRNAGSPPLITSSTRHQTKCILSILQFRYGQLFIVTSLILTLLST